MILITSGWNIEGQESHKTTIYTRDRSLMLWYWKQAVEYGVQESRKTTIYTKDRSVMLWYWKPTGGILRGKKVIKIQYTPRTDHLCHNIENNKMEYWGANICWPLTCELWARYHHHHLTINWKFWVTTSSERESARARSPLPHLRMHFSILRPFVKIPKRSVASSSPCAWRRRRTWFRLTGFLRMAGL